ncbi:MAG: response regulator transcription factor [Rhodothermales bacterium]
MSQKISYEEELQNIASSFTIHLQKQLKEIDATWQQQHESQPDTFSLQSLSDIAHELHGQGLLFGYPEITKSAGALEEILERIIKSRQHLTAQIRSRINAHIHNLKQAATHEVQLRGLLFSDQEAITAIFDYKNRPAKKSAQKQILIIEDADVTRRRIAMSLRQAGFLVLEAADGISGVTMAIEKIPDLILLDIKMPVVDGFQVQQKIRTHNDLMDVPLIFLTSLNRVSIAQIQTALSYGITDYISKPFSMGKLISKIKTNLA